jgi:hypothetical protein
MRETILPANLEQRHDLELESLRRTQAALRSKTVNVALAIFFTTLVFCVAPHPHGLVVVLQRGGVWLAMALLLAGAYFWWRFVMACRELRGTGLPPQRGAGPRLAWIGAGVLISEAVAALVYGWTDRYPYLFFYSPAGGAAALWLGEKLRQVGAPYLVESLQTLVSQDEKEDDQAKR